MAEDDVNVFRPDLGTDLNRRLAAFAATYYVKNKTEIVRQAVIDHMEAVLRDDRERARERSGDAINIMAAVTLEGPAEEVLNAVRNIRGGGERWVNLSFELPRGRAVLPPFYSIPQIKAGQIQTSLENISSLARQTIINPDTEQRLDRLIREFGGIRAQMGPKPI